MKSLFDAIEPKPTPPPSVLTHEHFEAAAGKPNAFEMIRWAWENEEDPKGMLAWGRLSLASSPPRQA